MTELEKLSNHKRIIVDIPLGLVLAPCSYCGGNAILLAQNASYGLDGVWVCCKRCGASGPHGNIHALNQRGDMFQNAVTEETLEKGKEDAILSWNQRRYYMSRKARVGNRPSENEEIV